MLRPIAIALALSCLALLSPLHAFAQGGPWETHMAAGAKAYRQGQYAEAEKQLKAALKEAEKFGPEAHRLAVSLNRAITESCVRRWIEGGVSW